jgi:exonuclease III
VKECCDLVPEHLEAVCIEVNKTKSKPLIVTSLYRPPNSRIEVFDIVENLIENLDSENKEVILAGDFNCNLLAVNELNITNRLLDIANLFQLTQIITEETQTLLDLFFTNKPENIIILGWCIWVSATIALFIAVEDLIMQSVTKNCRIKES